MTSPQPSIPLTARSARVKEARKLARRAARGQTGRFLAEGLPAVREALAYDGPGGPCVLEVFAAADTQDRHPDLRSAARAADAAWYVVEDDALAGLSDTVTPQGLVAVCRTIDVSLEDAMSGPPSLAVVCAHVRDPGNAGAVIRCADAAGAGVVVLAGESVDPFNAKAVRASAGSVFHLPVVTGVSVAAGVAAARDAGLAVLAADAGGEVSTDDLLDSGYLRRRTAWIFGNEAWGLEPETAALADRVVRLPIYGRAESLNLATAAAICLYASARESRRPTVLSDRGPLTGPVEED